MDAFIGLNPYPHRGAHHDRPPNGVLATANHPVLPELREKAYQYNLPICNGRNCWLGAGVIVVPSVTIVEFINTLS